jgi:hypothetical protein
MSDKLDKWTAAAGCLALAVVLGLGVFADIRTYHDDRWGHDDPHPAITALLFDHSQH